LETAPKAIEEFQAAHRKLVQLEALYRQTDVNERTYTLVVSLVVMVLTLVFTKLFL
jgi:hypothetical protein